MKRKFLIAMTLFSTLFLSACVTNNELVEIFTEEEDTFSIDYMNPVTQKDDKGKEFIEAIIIRDKTKEKKPTTFHKNNIIIGEKTEILNIPNPMIHKYRIKLYLSKDDYVTYFYNEQDQ